MHRQNQVVVWYPNQMHGVLRAQSKLASGFEESLAGAAGRKRDAASLPQKPQSCPEQQKNERDSQ
jgi:hypothetical protein